MHSLKEFWYVQDDKTKIMQGSQKTIPIMLNQYE